MLAVRQPVALFALAAAASAVAGLCIGAFPVGMSQLLSAIGLSSEPLDATTAAVLYAIRAPRVLAAFAVGAALAAGGAAMQSLFRNPLADPGLLGVSSGAALAAVSVIVLGEKVMHVLPPPLKPWLLPVAAFLGGLTATIIVYRLAARDGITLVGTLLLAGIAINALTADFDFDHSDQVVTDLISPTTRHGGIDFREFALKVHAENQITIT